jgi:hypothetical protein
VALGFLKTNPNHELDIFQPILNWRGILFPSFDPFLVNNLLGVFISHIGSVLGVTDYGPISYRLIVS